MKDSAVFKWVAGALAAFVLGIIGNAVGSNLDIRERVAKVEEAVVYLRDLVDEAKEHDEYHHHFMGPRAPEEYPYGPAPEEGN